MNRSDIVTEDRQRTREFFRFFLTAYPKRTALMVFLMVVAGIAEGVGVMALIPALEFADSGGGPTSEVSRFVVEALRTVGLPATLGILLATIVVAMSLKAGLLWFAQKQIGFTVAGITRDLRLKLLGSWFDARWSYFSDRPIGAFANAVSTEATRASGSYQEACHLLAAFVQMAAYVTLAAVISWKVAIGTLGVGALMFVVFRYFFVEARMAGHLQTKLSRSLGERLIDVLQGMKPLKAMDRQRLVWPLLQAETEGLNLAQRRSIQARTGLSKLQEPILTLLLASGLYVLLGVQGQPLSQVMVLAFVFYRLMMHVNAAQRRFQAIQIGESAFFSLFEELERAESQRETCSGRSVVGVREGIRLDAVSFAYGDQPVLNRASAHITAGSFVAIMGESGSGKTTLADLIVGLYTPDEGQILIDGVPLASLDLGEWRQQIGYVPQEMLLFNETILNNVTLGDKSLTREDAERALRMADAWDFVQERPLGLDEPMGERGAMLSGGQRQRIAIARALVTGPSLLVLDEVTTSLDPVTEREICQTLASVSGEVTVLSISHQPAMTEVADMVLHIRDGRLHLVESPAMAG